MFKARFSKLTIALTTGAIVALAGLSGSYVVPLDNEAIQYATRPVDDPVARLQKKIASGELKLNFNDEHGYLDSVLKALDVPVESRSSCSRRRVSRLLESHRECLAHCISTMTSLSDSFAAAMSSKSPPTLRNRE